LALRLPVGGAFWGLILLLYPLGRASSTQIWIAGIFVGTIGILLLLGLQWVAMATQGTWIRGRGVLIIIFYIIKFIGFSYAAADDPSNGFFLSMLGFTFGVGFCEELCKALPLLWHYKKTPVGVRGARRPRCGRLGPGGRDWVRRQRGDHLFVRLLQRDLDGRHLRGALRLLRRASRHLERHKCAVPLEESADFDGIGEWYGWFIPLFKTLGLSMVLHGLYDTLLKREMEVGALLAAVASFALFFWLYERTVREEARFAPAAAGAA
jgi:hypothetical protein